jgi:hypothetical protein
MLSFISFNFKTIWNKSQTRITLLLSFANLFIVLLNKIWYNLFKIWSYFLSWTMTRLKWSGVYSRILRCIQIRRRTVKFIRKVIFISCKAKLTLSAIVIKIATFSWIFCTLNIFKWFYSALLSWSEIWCIVFIFKIYYWRNSIRNLRFAAFITLTFTLV